jgi:hypothetical protein
MKMRTWIPKEANDATIADIRELAVAPSDWVAVPAPQFKIPSKPVALHGCDGPGGEDIVGGTQKQQIVGAAALRVLVLSLMLHRRR